jgi:hypothetical protein
MNDTELRCLCAGLSADEIRADPQHGLLISASGARKLAALASDPERAQVVRDQVADAVRRTLRVLPGGK